MDFHHQKRDSSTFFLPPFSVESGWRCWRCWFNQSLICDSADMFFWACENQLLPCLNHCGWIGWSSELASLLTTWFPQNMCCFFPWLDLSMAHFLGAGISWKKTGSSASCHPLKRSLRANGKENSGTSARCRWTSAGMVGTVAISAVFRFPGGDAVTRYVIWSAFQPGNQLTWPVSWHYQNDPKWPQRGLDSMADTQKL